MSKAAVKRFERSFFEAEVTSVAKGLLGCYLHRTIDDQHLIGRIVETEAYHQSDPASHSFRGMTERNKVMFGEAGFAYVYFTYGMHHCVNVVTGATGTAEAVLIRALEPIAGTPTMFLRRSKARKETDLLSGPGKLCEAFGITREQNGVDLITSDVLFLSRSGLSASEKIGVSARVGISVAMEKQWRFFLKDNPFVSKGRPSI